MTQGVVVSVIHHVPGLPYSAAYAAWDAHVPGCELCLNGMAVASLFGLDRTPDRLCPVGGPLDSALRDAIEAQHDDSRMN